MRTPGTYQERARPVDSPVAASIATAAIGEEAIVERPAAQDTGGEAVSTDVRAATDRRVSSHTRVNSPPLDSATRGVTNTARRWGRYPACDRRGDNRAGSPGKK